MISLNVVGTTFIYLFIYRRYNTISSIYNYTRLLYGSKNNYIITVPKTANLVSLAKLLLKEGISLHSQPKVRFKEYFV